MFGFSGKVVESVCLMIEHFGEAGESRVYVKLPLNTKEFDRGDQFKKVCLERQVRVEFT